MAINAIDIRDEARQYIYGTGLGEKPTLVQGAGTTSVTGDIVTFDIADGTDARPADILSVYAAADAANAFSVYVLSVATDTITGVNGYEGAAWADSVSVASTIFEISPLVGEAMMFDKIDAVIGRFLWPQVFTMDADTVTPDLSDGQVDLDTRDEEIVAAWQKIGGQYLQIPYAITKNAPIGDFPSGKMGSFDASDGSLVFYTVKRRVTLADTTSTPAMISMIATGAAALALGSALVEAKLEAAKKDSQNRVTLSSDDLWTDFVTQKQAFNEDLSRDVVISFAIDRG